MKEQIKTSDSNYILQSLSTLGYEAIQSQEKDFLIKFLSNIPNIQTIKDFDVLCTTNKIKINASESPDLIIETPETIYGIEHFSVDDSISNEEGSSYRKIYNDKYWKKNYKQLLNYKITGYPPFRTETINIPLDYKNLFNNIIISFNKHYSKIETYKKNILTEFENTNKEIKIFFFIQDRCLFPSFIFDVYHNLKFIYPYNDIQFINYLKTKSNLDGMFYDYEHKDKQFILCNLKNLTIYKIDNDKIFDFTKTPIRKSDNPTISSGLSKI